MGEDNELEATMSDKCNVFIDHAIAGLSFTFLKLTFPRDIPDDGGALNDDTSIASSVLFRFEPDDYFDMIEDLDGTGAWKSKKMA